MVTGFLLGNCYVTLFVFSCCRGLQQRGRRRLSALLSWSPAIEEAFWTAMMLRSLPLSLRRVANSRLQQFGYSLKWMPPRVLSERAGTLEVEFSRLAAHLMLSIPRPYFINIGANDGIVLDPIYPFVRDSGWTGIMVEPIPEVFVALQRNYAAFDGIALVQAAIGRTDGSARIYSVDPSCKDFLAMSLHSSFDRDVLLTGMSWHPALQRHIIEREVPMMSFRTLLGKANGRAIDVLKIDAEGADLDILRTVDFSHVSPRLIIAERTNLSRSETTEMAGILLDHGYQVGMTPLDMLGYKKSVLARPTRT